MTDERDRRTNERFFGGGTHRVTTITEVDAATASARFLARQEDALRRAEASAHIEDTNERIIALERAVHDWLNA